jgi:hypothetical protein
MELSYTKISGEVLDKKIIFNQLRETIIRKQDHVSSLDKTIKEKTIKINRIIRGIKKLKVTGLATMDLTNYYNITKQPKKAHLHFKKKIVYLKNKKQNVINCIESIEKYMNLLCEQIILLDEQVEYIKRFNDGTDPWGYSPMEF